MSDYDDRSYELGKGKPPKEMRWKKGQLGNPKGRPRSKRDPWTMTAAEIVGRLANELIPATLDGKQIMMPRKEAALTATFNDALTGNPLSRSRAIKLLFDIGAFNVDARAMRPSHEATQKFFARLLAESERHDREDEDQDS